MLTWTWQRCWRAGELCALRITAPRDPRWTCGCRCPAWTTDTWCYALTTPPCGALSNTSKPLSSSLEEGVIVIGPSGAVESVNPAALRILGVPGVDGVELAKVATVPVYDANGRLLSADQRPVLETLTSRPTRGGIYGVDRRGDGRRTWVSANWSLLDATDPSRSSVLVSSPTSPNGTTPISGSPTRPPTIW